LDSGIFVGGSLLAAFVAGGIALFAPCCISVMLPSYFAASMQNRRVPVVMTGLFAAGIATVILPLALGAAFLRRLLVEAHTPIFVVGGVLLAGLGVYLLWGGELRLPMPGRRAGRPAGPLGVYTLGVFSGVASSCCAPVLAGVVALSGVASSFMLALGLGLAYVAGMVFPLLALAAAWSQRDWSSTWLFRARSLTWRVGPITRTVSGTNLVSGALLAAMGGLMVVVGLASDAMPAAEGWQARFSVWLQNLGRALTDRLEWVPAWVYLLLALVAGWLLWRRARAELAPPADVEETPPTPISTEKEST
jgi:cytochrome c biogenesis protein CcdA